ncbi:Holliday junction endonuclease RuvC [Polynucleobacter kasalickyi]|uniref:Crossover junction endodeoxyribonuclease RuvC n=2 Tax=Polynucleobacter kasalickyi TaxID=1938817 RepID=A0A1W1YP20_9BURK|nr:Holliday junction endonuclease RuvC [Polynucleobacter kasalickyi]
MVLQWSTPARVTLDTNRMRIVGIDPGLRITGFGVIEFDQQRLKYIASGVIKTSNDKESNSERLGTIFNSVTEVITTYQPDISSIEQVFVNINPQSTLALGQARGAAIAALVCQKLPVYEFSALQVKKNVVGSGHAKKEQVQEMVRRLLSLKSAPSKDAADALAVAICAAHHHQMNLQIQKSSKLK